MALTENEARHEGDEKLSANNRKRKHEEVDEENEEDDNDVDSDESNSDGDGDDDDDDEDSETLHIVVRRVGKSERDSLSIELGSNATVLDLKEKIAESLEDEEDENEAVPVERQRLIFSGRMLRDDGQLLEGDLNMKPGDNEKHFVHLTPLPKGVAPSVRTQRELSENPLSPQEETLQRVRARQRRRRRHESEREQRSRRGVAVGMSDPAAYHPYALDLNSGSLLPAAAAAAAGRVSSARAAVAAAAAAPLALALSGASPASAEEEALSGEVQHRLVQEVARRATAQLLQPEAAVVVTQQAPTVDSLLDASRAGVAAATAGASLVGGTAAGATAAAVAGSASNPFCPLSMQQAETAASLLESALLGGSGLSSRPAAPSHPPVAESAFSALIRYSQPQTQYSSPPASGAAAAMSSDQTNLTVAALQELLGGSNRPAPAPAPLAPQTAESSNAPLVAALQEILGSGGGRQPFPPPAAPPQPAVDGGDRALAVTLQDILGGGLDILGGGLAAAARPPPVQIATPPPATSRRSSDPTVAALQTLLDQPQTQDSLRALLGGASQSQPQPPQPQQSQSTIQLLEGIASGAEELATTLRLLGGQGTATSAAGAAASLPTVVTTTPPVPPAHPAASTGVTATNTPQDLATRLSLEQSLSAIARSFPPFF